MNAYDLGETVLARLKATTGFTTYDGEVTDTPTQAYVVLHRGAGQPVATRLADLGQSLQWAVYVTCAGFSTQQAANTVELVRARLTGWRPDPSPACSPLRESDTGALIARDDAAPEPTRFWLPLRYTLTTHRS